MAGALRMPWQPMTLRELWITYQGHLLDSWDHTAAGMWATRSVWSKKPVPFFAFHPFRKQESGNRRKVTPKSIGSLGRAMMGDRFYAIQSAQSKSQNDSQSN